MRVAAGLMPSRRANGVVLACFLGNASLGWFLNGLGAILPPLRDAVGEGAGTYALLPGAVLLAWGLFDVSRPGRALRPVAGGRGLFVGSFALAATVFVMGLTRWPIVSVLGAVAAAVAAAHLNRLVPGILAALRAEDTERVMMRANAYASTAVLVAPLAVGASIALGAGWLPGFGIPLAIGAVAVAVAVRRTPPERLPAAPTDDSHRRLPPWASWWREWVVLWLSIVVEFCFAYFVVTFLNEELGLSEASAAFGGAAWGIGMLVGRFAFSRWAPPSSVVPSAITILAGFSLFWLVPQPGVAIAGICVAGLGASPLYPSRITALIARFPNAPHDGSTRGGLAAGAALLAAPALMVSLRAVSDVRTAYLVVPMLLVVLVGLARPSIRANAR
ncbi:MAG: MFS transporter [Ilumatobacteraceae bacterium]